MFEPVRFIIIGLLMVLATSGPRVPSCGGQESHRRPLPDTSAPTPPDFEAMRARADIEARESERRKAVKASEEILALARRLKNSLVQGENARINIKGGLEHIEKMAKRIRSLSRGAATGDDLKEPPADLATGLDQIIELAQGLKQELEKIPRDVISIRLIEDAETLIHLSRYLREQFLGA